MKLLIAGALFAIAVILNLFTANPMFDVSTGNAAPSAIRAAGVTFVPVVRGTTLYIVFGFKLLNVIGAPGALGVVNGCTTFPDGSTNA